MPFRGRDDPQRGTISNRPKMELPSDLDSPDSDLEEEPVQDVSPGRAMSRSKQASTSPSPDIGKSTTASRYVADSQEMPIYAKPRIVVSVRDVNVTVAFSLDITCETVMTTSSI